MIKHIKNIQNISLCNNYLWVNSTKKAVLLNLEMRTKRKLISEIISKINQNNFIKTDFDKLSKEKNIPIERVSLLNQNDNKILKEELVNKIYTIPEKKLLRCMILL